MKKIILFVFISFFATTTFYGVVLAEQVFLKSGQTISGVLTEYRNGLLRVDTGEDIREIDPQEIDAIIAHVLGEKGELKDLRISGENMENLRKSGEFAKIFLSADDEDVHYQEYIAALYASERFTELEKILSELHANQPRMRSGKFKSRSFYEGIPTTFRNLGSTDYTPFIKSAEKWKAAYPDSIAPYCLIAMADKAKAWYYRGGGWANSVSEENKKLFQEYAEKCAQVLSDGEKVRDKDEYFYFLKTDLPKFSNIPKSRSIFYMRKALAINPYFYDAYRNIAVQSLPRWGGYPGQMEEFADFAYENSPDGLGAFHYAVVALIAMDYDKNVYMKQYHFDWEKIKEGFLLVHNKYPVSLYWLNALANFACVYEDRDTAQKAFYFIGERWDPKSERIWAKDDCDRCRNWAFSGSKKELSPIFEAVRTNNFEQLQKLHEEGADLNAKDESGRTPLMIAVINNHEFLAKKLIRFGVNVNIADKNGVTALHYASENPLPDVVQMLLDAGADVNAAVTEKYAKKTPLHFAAITGSVVVFDLLLKNPHANLHVKDEKGRMPLHLAAKQGQISIVKAVIDKDSSNLDYADDFGWTPLTYASSFGFTEIVELLIQKGADVNHKAKDGKTALNWAEEHNHMATASKLKEFGAIASNVVDLKAMQEKANKANTLGLTYVNNKEYDKAIEQFDLCIKLLPDEPEGYFNKSLVVRSYLKDYPQSIDLINKAIELDPNNGKYYFNRAVTYVQMNDQKSAQESFDKCIAVAPDSSEAQIARNQKVNK